MNCDETREILLGLQIGLGTGIGWGAAGQQRAAEALEHMGSCDRCQKAMNDADRVRQAVRFGGDEISEFVPAGGWAAFENRLVTSRSHRHSWRTAIGGIAAALLFCSAAGFYVYHRQTAARQVATGQVTNGQGTGGQVTNGQVTAEPRNLFPQVPSSAGSAGDSQLMAVGFVPHDVANQFTAFDQIAGGDEHTSWTLDSNHHLVKSGTVNYRIDQRDRMLLRLSVTHEQKPLSSADLVIVPGQHAELFLPLPGGQELHYLVDTSIDERTHLAVVGELTAHGQSPVPVGSLTTVFEVPLQEQTSAAHFVTGAGAYRLDVAFTRSAATGHESP